MVVMAAGGETILRDAPVNGSRVSLDYPINSRSLDVGTLIL